MYAFRKPFTAATFESVSGWETALDFKTALLLSQVAGYALSKFIGIKVISEMTAERRVRTLLGLVISAWFALLMLPLLPTPWNIAALFLNGLPLGMIWGLVFSYLEGRRVTEAVGVILCASFIFGSGVVKSVGRWLLIDFGVPELWMPFAVGSLFVIPLFFFTFMLARTPPPSREDVEARKERIPLCRNGRLGFFRQYGIGLVALVIPYVFLTALRDFTDNFSAEVWIALGYGDAPGIFAITSLPITLVVLGCLALMMLIRDNRRALLLNHFIVAGGFLLALGCTLAFQQGLIGGVSWFILLNTGLYLGYVPFNCILFDRLVAATHSLANAGFLIYVADAFGYLGSVGVLLYKAMAYTMLPWIDFIVNGTYVLGLAGLVLTLVAAAWFSRTLKPENVRFGHEQPDGRVSERSG
jgi:hypothetical protein